MPTATGECFECLQIGAIAAWATASAAFVSFHCIGELPSSTNIAAVSREGPWWVHSYETS